MKDKKPQETKKQLEILEIIGIFWIFLGIMVLIAVYFPSTWIGKITDLIAGLILLGIGIFAFLKGRSRRKTLK
jgi:uncharacterized membrane protein YczE